ncbi:hypothetical protein RHOFW510R12_00420 [Rhodanobacter sp. FW510-R12]|uniref:DUF72 domain-containing protein n=1 Tax=Rhodanobacter thiooxydans TaxID=416169 RepID=UPI000918B532|nr:DUF72 domain-containing protein [Rhodanobacter thiooxydans]UJJ56705.1 DUF72 domain-containing protein [Rhodanobacter thiooxydans]
MSIRVGTASWTDKTLIDCGRFYPPDCKSPEDRLRYYASQFPIVELDSSYYALPSATNAQRWAERTPENFVMNVKAFRALTTHQTPHKALPRDLQAQVRPGTRGNVYLKDMPAEVVDELWRRFLVALQPLDDAGRLGALHFQFPPWFVAKREHYAYLDEVRERLERYTVAVEFRHRSWFTEETTEAVLAFHRERRFVNVVVDEPQGPSNTIPAVWAVTNPDLTIVRLHGRNHATWNIRDATSASDRFDYDYSAEELAELASPILAMAGEARDTHVLFNNNREDQGQRNARSLMDLLPGVMRPA